MERDFACELFRALEADFNCRSKDLNSDGKVNGTIPSKMTKANPHYPIAAPQIYEAGD